MARLWDDTAVTGAVNVVDRVLEMIDLKSKCGGTVCKSGKHFFSDLSITRNENCSYATDTVLK